MTVRRGKRAKDLCAYRYARLAPTTSCLASFGVEAAHIPGPVK